MNKSFSPKHFRLFLLFVILIVILSSCGDEDSTSRPQNQKTLDPESLQGLWEDTVTLSGTEITGMMKELASLEEMAETELASMPDNALDLYKFLGDYAPDGLLAITITTRFSSNETFDATAKIDTSGFKTAIDSVVSSEKDLVKLFALVLDTDEVSARKQMQETGFTFEQLGAYLREGFSFDYFEDEFSLRGKYSISNNTITCTEDTDSSSAIILKYNSIRNTLIISVEDSINPNAKDLEALMTYLKFFEVELKKKA